MWHFLVILTDVLASMMNDVIKVATYLIKLTIGLAGLNPGSGSTSTIMMNDAIKVATYLIKLTIGLAGLNPGSGSTSTPL